MSAAKHTPVFQVGDLAVVDYRLPPLLLGESVAVTAVLPQKGQSPRYHVLSTRGPAAFVYESDIAKARGGK